MHHKEGGAPQRPKMGTQNIGQFRYRGADATSDAGLINSTRLVVNPRGSHGPCPCHMLRKNAVTTAYGSYERAPGGRTKAFCRI